jgi:ABC-2 type transport system ATP-binding protein
VKGSAAKTTAAKSTAAKTTAARKPAATKAAPAKAAATKTAAAKSAAAATAAAKTTAAKPAAVRTSAAKTTAAKATAAKSTAARTTAASSAAAKKASATKASAAKATAAKASAAKAATAAEIVDDGQAVVAETVPAQKAGAPAAAAKPVAATPSAETLPAETPVVEAPAAETPVVEAPAVTAAVAAVAVAVPEDSVAEAPIVEAPPVEPEPAAELEAPAAPVVRAKAPAKKKGARRIAAVAPAADAPVVLQISALSKHFGETTAVDQIELAVRTGSFYGIVGPNGAGKTTTLSMVTGLLRPDAGTVSVHGIDVWADPVAAKRTIGVLPDRLRLFDRLTGAQLLYYSGILRGLDNATVRERSADLAAAFGLEDALNRLVADYSAGMTKKIALACAMIHSPRLLVLDEPFEAVDPVSAANLTEILQKYVAAGGTVVLSSHGMDLIERVCDSVAIIVHGQVLASGTLDEVRGAATLEERFVELAGGRKAAEGMEWLHSFSD